MLLKSNLGSTQCENIFKATVHISIFQLLSQLGTPITHSTLSAPAFIANSVAATQVHLSL